MFFLIIDSKIACWVDIVIVMSASPAFLKTGHIVSIFRRLGKHRSFRKCLNSFTKIGDNSGLILLGTTTGILSGPVAFLKSSITLVIHEKWGKSSKSLFLSFNIELEIKFIAKKLGNVITLGLFKIAGTEAFLLSRILFDNFHNS